MKTATIITTHAPKFYLAAKFLKSFLDYVEQPHSLYFIFSNKTEKDIFIKTISQDFIPYFQSITLPENLQNKKSIVNVKKIYALQQIINEYNYIGVYDCESQFVKKCNLDIIYKDICNKNIIKANESKIGGNIIKSIAEKLQLIDNLNLIEQTENYSLYWWFNEIPVYEKQTCIEFLEWYNTNTHLNILQNEYYCFDYLVYGIWLICYKNIKAKKIETPFVSDIGAVENFRLNEEERNLISKLFDSYWSTNAKNQKKFDKIKLIFHTDNCGPITK